MPLHTLLAVVILLAAPLSTQAELVSENPYIVSYVVEDSDFEDVKFGIRNAILGEGLNIANELHASEMLNRTGPDLGFPEPVYIKAETLEFCSAVISHRLVAANINNMVLCPFTISIYVLTAEPDKVYVAYRRPVATEESAEAVAEIEQLLQRIIDEAIG